VRCLNSGAGERDLLREVLERARGILHLGTEIKVQISNRYLPRNQRTNKDIV
jgi:hypothetical protein